MQKQKKKNMNEQSKKQRPVLAFASLDHMVAGTGAGLVTTAILHPLDLIKIRMQVQDGREYHGQRYVHSWDAIKTITKYEGASALYQGISPNLWGSGIAWGLYFLGYNIIKEELTSITGQEQLGALGLMVSAAVSGAITQVITNPIWVVKTRMCAHVPTSKSTPYKGLLDGMSSILKQEGVKGLYRGLIPGLLGITHGALQFTTYEKLKRWISDQPQYKSGERTMGSLEYTIMAAGSKMFASAASYPYQVVRTRLQHKGEVSYKGMWDVLTQTWNREGFRGFYKGLGPNLLRVTPATCITFVVYEKINKWMKDAR